MFYLSPRSRIIVSVPGNIRNSKQNKAKQNRKKEGEKERSGEEQKFSLFVTNKMRMFFFCFFFSCFIFYSTERKGLLTDFFVSSTFVSLLFLSFLCFWEKSHSWRLSKAATWVWFLFSYCKETRGAPAARFVYFSWSRGFESLCLIFVFFPIIACAQKCFELLSLRRQRNVFYSEHSFPYNKKKNKKINTELYYSMPLCHP